MHANFFWQPEGEDSRSIGVVHFPSSIVDNPVGANEYKMDRMVLRFLSFIEIQ